MNSTLLYQAYRDKHIQHNFWDSKQAKSYWWFTWKLHNRFRLLYVFDKYFPKFDPREL